jgi:hypothetical protein
MGSFELHVESDLSAGVEHGDLYPLVAAGVWW